MNLRRFILPKRNAKNVVGFLADGTPVRGTWRRIQPFRGEYEYG